MLVCYNTITFINFVLYCFNLNGTGMDIKETDLPYWLLPKSPPKADLPVKTTEPVYTSAIWGEIREYISAGKTLSWICSLPHMPSNQSRLHRWIMSDEKRREEYFEAKKEATYALEDKMLDIADGVDNEMEDVSRSKLRIETIKYIMSVNNKERYEKSNGTNINLTTNNNQVNHTIKIVAPPQQDEKSQPRVINSQALPDDIEGAKTITLEVNNG